MTGNITGFATLGEALDDLTRLQFIIEQMINGIATATLVRVEAVHASTVDVRPLVNQIDGANTGIDHGIIHGLPFYALQGGASAFLVTPKAGDKGLAVFCHNDISTVKNTQAQANPGSRRRYSWSDGIYMGALPMLNAAPTQTIAMDDDGITITSNGTVTINGNVSITGTLTNNGKAVGSTHTHSGVQTGGGTSGPPV
jgi:hypothetical protein